SLCGSLESPGRRPLMSKVLTLARREYLAAVRTKGFIVGLVLAPLLMSGGFIGMAIFKDQVDTTDQRIAIVDRSGILADVIRESASARNRAEVKHPKTGKKVKPVYIIETITPDDRAPELQRLE